MTAKRPKRGDTDPGGSGMLLMEALRSFAHGAQASRLLQRRAAKPGARVKRAAPNPVPLRKHPVGFLARRPSSARGRNLGGQRGSIRKGL